MRKTQRSSGDCQRGSPFVFSNTYNLARCLMDPTQVAGSAAVFNHAGDGILLVHNSEHAVRVMDFPSLTVCESPAAHVGGTVALALDPRGRYGIVIRGTMQLKRAGISLLVAMTRS